MANQGTIYGSFSGCATDKARPYIKWKILSQDIENNKSNVQAELWFAKYNSAYWGYNLTGNATGNIKIDTTKNNANITFDTRGDTPKHVKVRTWSKWVDHNSDGTKSCWIGADGDTKIDLYGTFNFGQTVQLDTIPREAYITNQPDFVAYNGQGTTVHLEFWNDGDLYIKVKLVVNGNVKHEENLGKVKSADIDLTASENDSILSEFPNSKTTTGTWEVYTYTDSNYSNQVNQKRDKDVTITADENSCKPLFSDYDLSNEDKTITIIDKYGNNLGSSSTSTLLGTDQAVIIGYSKAKAVIDSSKFMQARAHAAENKYVFSDPNQQTEHAHDGNTVTMYLDNVTSNTFGVTAYDSRNYGTVVYKSLEAVNYFNVTIDSIETRRDNQVDEKTKLIVQGKYFNQTFGSQGQQNALTVEYRWKYSTDSWGSQSWTQITPTLNGNNWSFEDYIEGDKGSDGFDMNKSFDVEVRVYDKLSVTINAAELDRGIPLIDFTQNGVAMFARYNTNEGGAIQAYGRSLMRIGFEDWWKVDLAGFEASYKNKQAIGAYKYSEINVPDSSIFQIGDKIKLKQGSEYKFFTVIGIPDSTSIEVAGAMKCSSTKPDFHVLANEPITEFYISKGVNPQGWCGDLQGTTFYGLGTGFVTGYNKNLWHNSYMGQARFDWYSTNWGRVTRESLKRRIKIYKDADDAEFELDYLGIRREDLGDTEYIAGGLYTISGEAYKSAGDAELKYYLKKVVDGNWSTIKEGVIWAEGDTSTGSRRFMFTFKMPDDSGLEKLSMEFHFRGGNNDTTFYLRHLKSERGIYATPWAPRPISHVMVSDHFFAGHLGNNTTYTIKSSTKSYIAPLCFALDFRMNVTATGADSDKTWHRIKPMYFGGLLSFAQYATPHWGYEGGAFPTKVVSENREWIYEGHKGGNSDAYGNAYILGLWFFD